jgi:hypothetical protein
MLLFVQVNCFLSTRTFRPNKNASTLSNSLEVVVVEVVDTLTNLVTDRLIKLGNFA